MDECVYQFDDVRVDARRFQVLRAGRPVDLEPKALEVLLFLIERRERMVLKEELLDGVWRDTFVTPNALTRVIAQLRKALGDDAQEARIIETVPRKGYRFLPDVSFGAVPVVPATAPPPIAARPRTAAAAPAPAIWRVTVPLLAGAFLALTGWSWLRPAAPAPLMLTDLVQVTTAAGYEADPSLSPDSRRLAYTAEASGFNGIYVRPVGDGNRIQVTSDGGQNVESVWSPDGESLAYHSRARGGIWIRAGVRRRGETRGSARVRTRVVARRLHVGILDLRRRARRAGRDHDGPRRGRRGASGDPPGHAKGRAPEPGVVARRPARRVLLVRQHHRSVALDRTGDRRRADARGLERHAGSHRLHA